MKFLSRAIARYQLMRDVWRVAGELAAERARQTLREGFTVAHDDAHRDRSMAMVAALYAAPRDDLQILQVKDDPVTLIRTQVVTADPWPPSWGRQWDKRSKHMPRRRLVIAGALIIAELQRIDRAAVRAQIPKSRGAYR